MKHRYLLILEIAPVEVGKTYDNLLSHLTLMSRFFSELPSAQLDEDRPTALRQDRSHSLSLWQDGGARTQEADCAFGGLL